MFKRRRWLAGLLTAAVIASTWAVVPAAAAVVVCPRFVSVENHTEAEGSPAAGDTTKTFVFQVTSSGCMQAGTAKYTTVPALARESTDFVSTSGTLTFAAGVARRQTVAVDVVMDSVREPDELFYFLVCPSSGVLEKGAYRAVGMVVNDDDGPAGDPEAGTIPELHCSE
jgi:hypothetical protein